MAAEPEPPDHSPPPPDGALDRLDARLVKAREREKPLFGRPGEKGAEDRSGPVGLAFRISVELVSALGVGLGIGWLLDQWLGTRPWLMVVFIVLGGGAGILNVYRQARGFGYAVGYRSGDPENNQDS